MKSLWKYLCALCSSGKQYYVKGIRIGEKIATKSPLIDGQNLAKSFNGQKKAFCSKICTFFSPNGSCFWSQFPKTVFFLVNELQFARNTMESWTFQNIIIPKSLSRKKKEKNENRKIPRSLFLQKSFYQNCSQGYYPNILQT